MATQAIRELQNKSSYITFVLLDDYNPKTWDLKGADYVEQLDREGLRPNYWAYESTLVPHNTEFLELVNNKSLRRNYERHVQDGHSPCSLLTAIWYAIRLGRITANTKVFRPYEYSKASRLINVLPKKYEESESKTKRLLDAAGIDSELITTRFFESDDETHYEEPI